MKKELLLYLLIFIFSALLFHTDLLYAPMERIKWMGERSNYYHPFVFTFTIYLIVGTLRLIMYTIKKLLKK